MSAKKLINLKRTWAISKEINQQQKMKIMILKNQNINPWIAFRVRDFAKFLEREDNEIKYAKDLFLKPMKKTRRGRYVKNRKHKTSPSSLNPKQKYVFKRQYSPERKLNELKEEKDEKQLNLKTIGSRDTKRAQSLEPKNYE